MIYVIKKSTPSILPIGSPISGDWLSVDPGLGGTGWAKWHGHTLEGSGSYKGKGGPWHERAADVAKFMQGFPLFPTYADTIYYELPFIALDGGKTEMSARKQDVIKLTMLAGMIASKFERAIPVPVIRWKGQLSKTLSKERVVKQLSRIQYRPRTKTSHEIDAIGIGFYVIKQEGRIPE